MKRMLATLASFTLFGASAAELTGAVSFDKGLYTYRYELSASEYPVTQVLVMIKSDGGNFSLRPTYYGSPGNWSFNTYTGVNPNFENPFAHGATYWGWGVYGRAGTEAVNGFSFTTDAPPAANPVPVTYMLFAPGYRGGRPPLESEYVGSVVAPDFLAAPIPEPSTVLMFLGGLALVGCAAKSKARET